MPGDPQIESAQVALQWLDLLKSSNSVAFDLIDEFIQDERATRAMYRIKDSLSLDDYRIEAETFSRKSLYAGLSEQVQKGGGSTADISSQISLESSWTDPPVPSGGEAFDFVLELKNSGTAESGPYQTQVQVSNKPSFIVDCESVGADATAQVRVTIGPLDEGDYSVYITTPYYTDDIGTTVIYRAGAQVNYPSIPIQVGMAAAERERLMAEAQEIAGSLRQSKDMMEFFATSKDLSGLSNALQNLATCVPSLADELGGLATQVLARDPATVSPDDLAAAVETAKEAIVSATATETRLSLDNVVRLENFADRPELQDVAQSYTVVARAIIDAPAYEAPEDQE